MFPSFTSEISLAAILVRRVKRNGGFLIQNAVYYLFLEFTLYTHPEYLHK